LRPDFERGQPWPQNLGDGSSVLASPLADSLLFTSGPVWARARFGPPQAGIDAFAAIVFGLYFQWRLFKKWKKS
jgi:hypothetical protein